MQQKQRLNHNGTHNHTNETTLYKMQELTFKQNAKRDDARKESDTKEKVMGSKVKTGCRLAENN